MSGHHANIENGDANSLMIRTAKNRPDLLEKAELTENEKMLARKYKETGRPVTE